MLNLKTLYDHLKTNSTKIHFFGLGFIQVKVTDKERYHFYHPELTAFVPPEEIHDHRSDFTSTILKGVLSQEIYSITPQTISEFELRHVSCDANHKAPIDRQFVMPELIATTHFNRGSQYKLSEKTMHKVLPVADSTITLLQRGTKKKPFANVVSSAKEEICPFSKDLPEVELWEWVKRIIDD